MDRLDIDKTLPRDGEDDRAALRPGATLGQYRIIRLLGRGGMGEVYLVENIHNRKRYALKVLPPGATRDSIFVDRFRIESRVMSDLNHPHIVRVHHMGEANGLYYLTMDYIGPVEGDAETLEDLLAEGPLPERRIRELLLQICDALQYAHEHDVIHRDLKPSNILLDAQGQVKVSDFGLAKVVGDTYLTGIIQRSISLSIGGQLSMGDEKTLLRPGGYGGQAGRPKYEHTSTRSILGTYDYMSPEQKTGGDITARSDIYALGVMLYRMLTGKKPEGRWDLPSKLGCSRKWDAIVTRCLRPDPEKRYASVASLRKAVEKIACKWRRGLRFVVGGLLFAALVVGGWFGWQVLEGRVPSRSGRGIELTATSRRPGAMAVRKEHTERKEQVVQSKPDTDYTARHMKYKPEPEAGEEKVVNLGGGVSLTLVWVPAGSFQMGSNSGDSDEKPVHEVRISQGFWLGKYEVTQEQWQQIMRNNPSHFKGARNPVECVSWTKCDEFMQALNRKLSEPDYEYRLPTEAQWEYAARGGSTGGWYKYAGSDKIGEVAWYSDNSGKKTHAFGWKAANELGLHDMSGNVWEWCLDWYDKGYYGKSPEVDPVNASRASNRVIRGGSWRNSAGMCRTALRYRLGPSFTFNYLGFRVCLARRR